MIVPKRSIPRIGIATLVLGGCGDDVVDSPQAFAREACEYLERCEPVDFFMSYESAAECRATVERVVATYFDLYRDMYGDACADAFEEYYFCLGQEAAEQNDDDICVELSSLVCSAEYDRFGVACGF